MIMRTRNHCGVTLLVAAFLIFAFPRRGRADNLFRFFPELAGNGFYGDNIPLRTSNEEGDFGGLLVARLLP